MIRYLTKKEINIEKYDNCIHAAFNSRVYAFSWYLDIVADNWDVLVLNNYEAVMPLPWRQKYFIKYIYPPAWTQQLGVFSKNKISEALILEFIKAIPKKFKKITIQFNSENRFEHKNLTKRVNYILSLNKSYEDIYNNFRRDRKSRLKQLFWKEYKLMEISVDRLIDIGKIEYSHLSYNEDSYANLKKLENYIKKIDRGIILGVYIGNRLLGGVVFLYDELRLTYLYSVTTLEGKKENIISVIINEIIKSNSKSNLFFDFEGSMQNGIASFFKSFGAIKEDYYVYKKVF